jgi:2-isopropylmalate synthase
MQTPRVTLYDTTLRDGTQGTGISFSVRTRFVLRKSWMNSAFTTLKVDFRARIRRTRSFSSRFGSECGSTRRLPAFGATRRGRIAVEDDPQVRLLIDAGTPAVCIVGKTWPLHVTEVFQVSLEENLAMIADTVAFLKKHGREVLYDAEHFFDSYKEDSAYSLQTVTAARDAGADLIVLCDTNGGSLPDEVGVITREVIAALGAPVGIHTTTTRESA